MWQWLNNVSALVGLAVFTFVLTYLFQVVTAVTQQRAVATTIDGLGDNPVDAVATALREDGLGQLPSQLTSLTSAVNEISRRRVALPLLQFFHQSERAQSIALNVVVLDEIVTILQTLRPGAHGTVVRPARQAVDEYVATTGLVADAPAPPAPDLSPLADAGDETFDLAAASSNIEQLGRRATLHAVIRQEAWEWDRDVYGHTASH